MAKVSEKSLVYVKQHTKATVADNIFMRKYYNFHPLGDKSSSDMFTSEKNY